jgi:hypothetical protein
MTIINLPVQFRYKKGCVEIKGADLTGLLDSTSWQFLKAYKGGWGDGTLTINTKQQKET